MVINRRATKYTKPQIILITIGLGGGLAILGTVYSYMPDGSQPSITGIVFSWLTGLLIGVCGYWNWSKPNIVAEGIATVALGNLCAAAGIRGMGYLPVGWIWVTLFLVLYLAAWILPRFNLAMAKFLHDEMYTPKTRLGRFLQILGMGLIGGGGALGASIGRSASRNHHEVLVVIISGLGFGFIAVIFAQVNGYKLWVKHQQQISNSMTTGEK
jgi:hypothetical protein